MKATTNIDAIGQTVPVLRAAGRVAIGTALAAIIFLAVWPPTPKVVVDVSKMSTEANAKLVKTIKDLESSAGDDTPFAADKELDALILKRTVLRQRGNWMQIGPEVSDQGR